MAYHFDESLPVVVVHCTWEEFEQVMAGWGKGKLRSGVGAWFRATPNLQVLGLNEGQLEVLRDADARYACVRLVPSKDAPAERITLDAGPGV